MQAQIRGLSGREATAEDETEECSICLTAFSKGGDMAVLPCGAHPPLDQPGSGERADASLALSAPQRTPSIASASAVGCFEPPRVARR